MVSFSKFLLYPNRIQCKVLMINGRRYPCEILAAEGAGPAKTTHDCGNAGHGRCGQHSDRFHQYQSEHESLPRGTAVIPCICDRQRRVYRHPGGEMGIQVWEGHDCLWRWLGATVLD